ncbi:MAG: CHAT domain-containing protein, partial [Leptolyngbya sp. SIO3F4]|nr:CHAT domain-containing protein [Leptolyngbya sp. SIO3F4]
MAANPSNAGRIRTDQELRDIQEELLKHRKKISLEHRMALKAVDVSRAILDLEPDFVHFSGHGSRQGELLFEDAEGQSYPVEPEAIADLFREFSSHIKCVVLNACHSELQANAISKYISYVIGMNDVIADKAAIIFSVGFYRAIGAGLSIDKAFNIACVEMRLAGISEYCIPCLIGKEKSAIFDENKQVQWSIVLSGNIKDCDKQQVDAITQHLRKLLQDSHISINKIEPGSIKLSFSGSEDSYEIINYLFEEGILRKILDFEIEDICHNSFDILSEASNNLQGLETANDDSRE